jgi:alcohol/geraniol dehydrogenase (NADP+)
MPREEHFLHNPYRMYIRRSKSSLFLNPWAEQFHTCRIYLSSQAQQLLSLSRLVLEGASGAKNTIGFTMFQMSNMAIGFIPDQDLATTGPLLCGGITVFGPFVINDIPSAARVGVIGIGGLGHMALQFANKWGCEVHAFTSSDSKEAEAKKLGAHFVHNTKSSEALKKISRSLDMIISTVNVPIDVSGLLEVLRPKGFLQQVGLIPQPLEVPVFPLLLGQKKISGNPTGSPVVIDEMLDFCARHSIAPVTETYPMSQINEAFEHLRSGKARYRVVLANDKP